MCDFELPTFACVRCLSINKWCYLDQLNQYICVTTCSFWNSSDNAPSKISGTHFFFFKFQVTSCILPLSYSSKKYSIQSDKAIVMGFLTVTFPHILDSVRFSWNKTNFKPFNFVVFLQHIYMWLMCLRKSLVCLRQNPSIKIFMPTINSMKAGLCLAYSMMYKHQ